jgi:formylglycine-generating enzyme required for sulfatase activity
MSNDAQDYNTAAIHQLLLAAFTPQELDRLLRFSSSPDLQDVAKEFSPADGLTAMADKAVDYCERHLLLPDLLTAVRIANRRQYDRFFGPEPPAGELEEPQEDQQAKPTPELALSASDRDTITSPPIREEKKPPEAEPVRAPAEVPSATSVSAEEAKKHPEDTPALPIRKILTIHRPIHLELVLVPAGEFMMGSNKRRDEHAKEDELPQHAVYVPEFYIGLYPVTERQFQVFAKAKGSGAPEYWGGVSKGHKDYPVDSVHWLPALAFCRWLSRETGQPFRLPTEAEWEKAARGTDGRIYPWGDEPPNKDRCNFGYDYHLGNRTPVDRYSPEGDSPYGCADMAGNVWEWCQSLWKPYPYRADRRRESLRASGLRVMRGGGFHSDEGQVRCAHRRAVRTDPFPDTGGFRVVLAPDPSGH